jgi:hypothetical protein
MTAVQVDPAWLNSVVTVEPYIDEGDYNETRYGDKITLNKCRVDVSKVFSGTGADRTIVANATVFLYAAYTNNYPNSIDDSWLQARLTYRGHEYKIVNWAAYTEPDSGEPFSIELEVI